jgi:hypothetical protein
MTIAIVVGTPRLLNRQNLVRLSPFFMETAGRAARF